MLYQGGKMFAIATCTQHVKTSIVDAIRRIPGYPYRAGYKDSLCGERSRRTFKLPADLIYICKGQFLPWHRHFMKAYENALRNECGYKGAQPYVFFAFSRIRT